VSPYRVLARREADRPRRQKAREASGASLVAFLWLLALGFAVLKNALGH
jgi:hypothetical protein